MKINVIFWLMVIGAAAAGLVAGTHYDSLYAGIAGACIGAGVVRLISMLINRTLDE